MTLWREEPGRFRAQVVWFSLRDDHPLVQAQVAAGGEAWVLHRGWLTRRQGGFEEQLLPVNQAPVTFGGAALFNVANALGACAAGAGLGLSDAALIAGLRNFRDNPGRANLYDLAGVRLLVDFGHNAHAVRQVGGLVAGLRAERPGGALAVISGCAGDRGDQNLRDLAAGIAAMRPQRVLLRDLPGYLRGRQPGEVPALLREGLLAQGLDGGMVELRGDEVDALRAALDGSRPGDLVVLLVRLDGAEVQAELRARGATRL